MSNRRSASTSSRGVKARRSSPPVTRVTNGRTGPASIVVVPGNATHRTLGQINLGRARVGARQGEQWIAGLVRRRQR